MTTLDVWGLYLTSHNTHNRQTDMPPVGFEPAVLPGERPYTARLLGPAFRVLHVIFSHMMSNRTMLLVPFNFLLPSHVFHFVDSRGLLTPVCWLPSLHKEVARLYSLSCYAEDKWHFFNLILKLWVGRECWFYVLNAEYLQANANVEQNEIFCLLPNFHRFLEAYDGKITK